MIKLIATDMDGTLLDDNKQLPENFDNIVKRLFNKNIRFVISSVHSMKLFLGADYHFLSYAMCHFFRKEGL